MRNKVDLKQAVKVYRSLKVVLEGYAKASPSLQDNIQSVLEALAQRLEEGLNDEER